jgi:hypothetical protein
MPREGIRRREQSLVALMDYRRRSGFDKANLAIAWGQGKEAATVRQFMLVVFLIGAAFAGGAVVNGPGLQWVQTRALRSLGLSNSGEITSVDLRPTSGTDLGKDESGLVKPEKDSMQAPLAPTPSLLTDNNSPQEVPSTRPSSTRPRSKSKLDQSAPSRVEKRASPAPAEQSFMQVDAPVVEPPATDREVRPANNPSASGPSRSSPDVPPAILDTLAALLPSSPPSSNAPSAGSPQQSAASAIKSIAEGREDWMVLERKMQSLGVSRYTIEGEPGSRVVFSCLIPLAGRQAVTQRFEAEGDDLVQAARAALRRIALWRASQAPSP